MGNYHMISPPAYIFTAEGGAITTFGWFEPDHGGPLEPVVGNPDGPGIGRWSTYYGQDPWTAH